MKNSSPDIQSLLQAFLVIKDKKLLHDFFADIFTPQEIEAFTERWHIVQLLLEGDLSQRAIAQKVGCSVSLVSRASRQIQYGSGGLKKVLLMTQGEE